jgi:integrase
VHTTASELRSSHRHRSLIRLLAYTGLPFGELAALRVRRIDFLRLRLTVAESATEVGGQLLFGTPKTHQQRTVPLPADLMDAAARATEEARVDAPCGHGHRRSDQERAKAQVNLVGPEGIEPSTRGLKVRCSAD